MLLAVDIGNTHTVAAVFEGSDIKFHWRVPSHKEETADDIRVLLSSLLDLDSVDKTSLDDAVICSVVPSLQASWSAALRTVLGRDPLIFTDSGNLGIQNRYKVPSEVGPDRLANVLIAFKRYSRDLIVVDLGTATTFDVLDKNGNYLGGIIAPGIEISAGALAARAARLTMVDISFPDKVVGDTTADSFRSGVTFGTVAMIEGIVEKIDLETSRKHFVIATGGLSELIADKCRRIDVVDPFITLYGLLEFFKLSDRSSE